jgi:hypothetical protein
MSFVPRRHNCVLVDGGGTSGEIGTSVEEATGSRTQIETRKVLFPTKISIVLGSPYIRRRHWDRSKKDPSRVRMADTELCERRACIFRVDFLLQAFCAKLCINGNTAECFDEEKSKV